MQAPIQIPAMPTTMMTMKITHCQWLESLGSHIRHRLRLDICCKTYQSPPLPLLLDPELLPPVEAEFPVVEEAWFLSVLLLAMELPVVTSQMLRNHLPIEFKPWVAVQASSHTPASPEEKAPTLGSAQKQAVNAVAPSASSTAGGTQAPLAS